LFVVSTIAAQSLEQAISSVPYRHEKIFAIGLVEGKKEKNVKERSEEKNFEIRNYLRTLHHATIPHR
jgi:hypothetical protein